jgi:hypothetical protein
LEICAAQIVTTDKGMIVICVYRSPSGGFDYFLRLLDMALLSLNNPSMEILICGDFNVHFLSNCNRKQNLSLLLGAYNMIHTVDFPTRIQNGHSSAIDNIFVDKSRMQSCKIFPLSNALSDHKVQCIILDKFFPETELKKGKHKNTHKFRIIVSETVNYFHEQLSQESWEDVFSTNDVNSSFNKCLAIFLTIFEASFPYKYLSNDRDRGWITQGIRFGFWKDRSTEHALVNGIFEAWNNKLQVAGIFCDLAKAFNSVNHGILIEKLK